MSTIREIIREWCITERGTINITDESLENVEFDDILVAIEIIERLDYSPFNIQSKLYDNGYISVPPFRYENTNNVITFITVACKFQIDLMYEYLISDDGDCDYSDSYYYYNIEYTKQVLEYCMESDVPLKIMFILLNMIKPEYDEYERDDKFLLNRYCNQISTKSARNI